jgi:hypothetical protein
MQIAPNTLIIATEGVTPAHPSDFIRSSGREGSGRMEAA